MGNHIKITCQSETYLDIDAIESLQGELKKISQASMDKLKSSIKMYGFSFPVFVWKSGKKHYSIDGIHRCKALKELESIDGYEIPKQVPVVYIQAEDKKQAKELLLAASSQYAAINKDYLMNDFISDLDFDNINLTIEIPKIDISDLSTRYNDLFNADDKDVKSDLSHKIKCPNCGFEILK